MLWWPAGRVQGERAGAHKPGRLGRICRAPSRSPLRARRGPASRHRSLIKVAPSKNPHGPRFSTLDDDRIVQKFALACKAEGFALACKAKGLAESQEAAWHRGQGLRPHPNLPGAARSPGTLRNPARRSRTGFPELASCAWQPERFLCGELFRVVAHEQSTRRRHGIRCFSCTFRPSQRGTVNGPSAEALLPPCTLSVVLLPPPLSLTLSVYLFFGCISRVYCTSC